MLRTEGASALFKGLTPKVRHYIFAVSHRQLTARKSDPRRWPEARFLLHPRAVSHSLVFELCLDLLDFMVFPYAVLDGYARRTRARFYMLSNAIMTPTPISHGSARRFLAFHPPSATLSYHEHV